jgi:hypothetical protein
VVKRKKPIKIAGYEQASVPGILFLINRAFTALIFPEVIDQAVEEPVGLELDSGGVKDIERFGEDSFLLVGDSHAVAARNRVNAVKAAGVGNRWQKGQGAMHILKVKTQQPAIGFQIAVNRKAAGINDVSVYIAIPVPVISLDKRGDHQVETLQVAVDMVKLVAHRQRRVPGAQHGKRGVHDIT